MACRDQFQHICGTTRSEGKFGTISGDGISPVLFDGATATDDLRASLASASHLLISIAPNDDGDPVLKALDEYLTECSKLQWIGYLSTVGVYGDHDGAWVDEETVCKPASRRSVQRMTAENAWQMEANRLCLPISIFRLSGIYGPGRNTFMNIEKGRARRLVKPGQVFNRIHREDIGSAVSLAIGSNASGIFNITDDEPAPPQDPVTYACELMGREPPPETDFETADLTPMARSFYGENKRVSNAKSKEVLGLSYAWPNYRESLKRMWKEGSWKP